MTEGDRLLLESIFDESAACRFSAGRTLGVRRHLGFVAKHCCFYPLLDVEIVHWQTLVLLSVTPEGWPARADAAYPRRETPTNIVFTAYQRPS